ncbi:uncharacterized protein LOC129889102 isoform X3 [Solanum dulcamara]|uniref:uncharacterized protein LOC129889102 isoform X3 n=1 Tax=Solanum dulcamara TaxID=45834 RepID=UPI002486490D|nr:uncharacterized protein LOC129889102 isoform X3 [Solanum dulcamara]
MAPPKLVMFSNADSGIKFPETGYSGPRHPRVFCLGLTGYLLLTTTGLLGVICFCHGSHMSISRFCQHSGLSHVNPGNAVRMDTGVTIAQWRKLFFHKLGIRTPEDHGGWDWPEVFPVSAGSAEFCPSLPNLSPNSELYGTFGASNGAGQSWNNMSISKNSQRPPLSNLDGIQDLENGSSFVSAYIGSNSKDINTFNSLPDLKISKLLGINSSLLQMDGSSVSSSIELRLGHPSQQSKMLGTLAQQTFEYHSIVKPMEYQQSLFPEPLMHKAVESQAVEESRSNFHMLNSSPGSGKGQLDLVNSAYGLHNTTSESRTRNSIFPVVQAQFKGPSEGLLYSEDIKNMVNGSHIPPGEPQSLTRGGSLRAQDSGVYCQLSSDLNAVHWPYLRHGGSECNISPSVEQANYFPVAPNTFMCYCCNSAVQPDFSVEKHHFIGEPLDTTQIEQNGVSGCITNLFACKLNGSEKVPLNNVASLEGSDLVWNRINKMECHSSQWRDVPKKVTGAVSLTFKGQKTDFLNMNEKMRGQNADAGGNKPSCDVAFQNAECLKEPEIPNVSSGGSAPVVTEASAVIHDNVLSTADGQKTLASNVVLDEGSGINRSWLSNDAQGSEQSAEFLGVACEFNPMDAGPSKGFADNSSRSLIDELRVRDSLKLKKMQNHSSFSIQEKSHRIHKVVDFSIKVIRKRTKWGKLDTTLPAVYSACGYPEGTCGSGLEHSCNDKQGALLSDNGSAEKCMYSIEPSFRERRFRMGSLNTLSCNVKVNCHDAKAISTQSDHLKVDDDDTFVACELTRRKRPKLDTATPVRQADEGYNLGVDAAAKCSMVDTSTFPEMHEKVYRRAVRPIVGQKYGVISNANPSKPVKFVSLRKICDSLEKCGSSGNSTAKLTSVKLRKASAKEKHRRINRSPYLKKVRICNANCVVTTKKSKSHLLTSSELDPCQSLEQSKRVHCHGGEQGAYLCYSLEKRRYDCLIETGNIADDSLPTPQKPLCKEIHKQDLNELTLEGIHPGEGDSTCARTEGYKGRKKEGVRYNFRQYPESGGGCLVAQEQLNAWIYITGQKPSRKEMLRLPPKDAEYDYRKEYARYKHSKGWKSLVVYKSGIHALGLYTSRFILQGEMVVEYVGEIVGLRVADKREIEYLSGKKLQYKSACYFFRVDREHIVDATQKGGIARFVNHSCLPNCVSRIISLRNEKKVVFFAERDIFPGEEITYDYNFNHEDEGKKIPCYCNSKNCRRYLN